MDEVLHPLNYIDDYIIFVLCYPYIHRCSRDLLNKRIEFLRSRGIRYLVETGRKLLNYRVLGKGYSSIVVKALKSRGEEIVLKIRRLDSRRKTLELEGMILDYLQPLLIVPKLYFWSRDIIGIEYVKCRGLIDYIREIYGDMSLLRRVLSRVFQSLYILDLLLIDHGELNRPYEHIFWCNSHIKIIDWESARPTLRPHNLTMFASYIFIRSGIFHMDRDTRNKIINILRRYKNDPTNGLLGLLDFLSRHEFSGFMD